MNVKGSSGRTAARRDSSSCALRPLPRSRTSSRVIGSMLPSPGALPLPVAAPPGGSITMIVRRFGRRSRIAAILASCSSSSHTTAQASESERTQ